MIPNSQNQHFDTYLRNGCMRCKLGGTIYCKVLKWVPELELLRKIVIECGLKEEIKWGVPVYTHHGKNIVTVNALKDSANIGFFKGALIADTSKLLVQQGNLQSDRLIKFKHVDEIQAIEDVLKSYIFEAIRIEESGQKVNYQKNPEPIPEELSVAFKEDKDFEKAFFALTPGRQRGYIIYFSQPKQSTTRIGRIQKCRAKIFTGKGIHDL